jgi:subtilisin family serine protease
MMITDHVYWTCAIIAGQFDTTTNGSLGIAPLSKLIPVSYGTNLELLEAIDFGLIYDARTIVISSGRHYKDTDWYKWGWESAYNIAVEKGVLPILAVGNDNKDPLDDVTTTQTLNVAGNVGAYRSSVTSYDAYPYVNISAAGYYTSFAAAVAAGVAALVLSRWPDLTVSELREQLLNSVDPMLDPIWDANLTNTKLGTGRLNAYKAIATKVGGEITEDVTWSGPIKKKQMPG